MTAGALPRPLTSFLGRESEVSRLQLLLEQSRLTTLAGLGGVRKTRLALEVGRAWATAHGHYVPLVELESVAEPLDLGALVSPGSALSLTASERELAAGPDTTSPAASSLPPPRPSSLPSPVRRSATAPPEAGATTRVNSSLAACKRGMELVPMKG